MVKIRKVITIFGCKHRLLNLIHALGNAEVVCQSYFINKKGDQLISPLTRRLNETPKRTKRFRVKPDVERNVANVYLSKAVFRFFLT